MSSSEFHGPSGLQRNTAGGMVAKVINDLVYLMVQPIYQDVYIFKFDGSQLVDFDPKNS